MASERKSLPDRAARTERATPIGVLNIDKPLGKSSRDVVNIVQRLVRPAKAGHAGTLDPLATGVLVVCVGPATRLIPYLHDARKSYRATFRFGITSTTDDLEGEVVAIPGARLLTRSDIEPALQHFVGAIEQVPPAYSAVHVGGQRAYALARRGETVRLTARTVEVFRFDLLAFDEQRQELDCEIECGSGTYIRSLGRDLAHRLGTGAVMTALRRTAVGPFRVAESTALTPLTRESLTTALHAPEAALPGYPRVLLDSEQERLIRRGRFLQIPDRWNVPEGGPVLLLDDVHRLIAIAVVHAEDASMRPKIVFPEHERG